MIALALLGSASLVSLLIWLLIAAVVIYVLFLVIGMLPLPPQVRTIVCLILGLILLLVILQRIGLLV